MSNFERHGSTRWVAARPSYGDDWGDAYSDAEPAERVSRPASPLPESHPVQAVSSSTLVLSIDHMRTEGYSDNEDNSSCYLDSPAVSSAQGHPQGPADQGPADQRSADQGPADHSTSTKPKRSQLLEIHVPLAQGSMDHTLVPPNIAFQNPRMTPTTPDTADFSDRSYVSDADLIQCEPARLNLASAPQAPPPVQEQKPGTTEKLVLSIDAMDLNASDSGDSSSDEASLAYLLRPDTGSGGHIKTDALDSLIDDILKLRDFEGPDEYEQSRGLNEEAPQTAEHEPEVLDTDLPPSEATTHEDSDRNTSRASGSNADHALPQNSELTEGASNDAITHNGLPALDSIHDMSLPNFDNHSFSSDAQQESQFRSQSIRKAPPEDSGYDLEELVADSTHHSLHSLSDDSFMVSSASSIAESHTELKRESDNELQENGPEQEESPEDGETTVDIERGEEEDELPPLPPMTDVSRRDSTMSNATFNMGGWKPNTNLYRDQFVGDNDNESQMNFSMVGRGDSTYNKFTGMRSNYATSLANSSCVSVPDTLETDLQQIDEDFTDDDELPEVVSLANSQTQGLTNSKQQPGSDLLASILEEGSHGPTFKEHGSSPLASGDQTTSDKATTADTSDHSIPTEPTPAPTNAKYPVFNWRKIMGTSQPVDRIRLLKKARDDEALYDTGLAHWLHEALTQTEAPSHMQIGKLATQAYQNAQHSDIRRHTSIRSKVNMVRDKMDGSIGNQASSLKKKFLSRGKKLIKPISD